MLCHFNEILLTKHVCLMSQAMSTGINSSEDISPVVSFLRQQFFELAQRDHPPFDRRPVGYQLLTEVIRHSRVLTGMLLSGFVSAHGQKQEHI